MTRNELAVPSGRHICLLYGDDEERFLEVSRFLSAGHRQGHWLRYIVDAPSAEVLKRRLEEVGLGSTEVTTTADAYYPLGRFEPEAMIASLEASCGKAVQDGFRGCRCTGEMGWATRGVPGSERLIEYEVRLTEVIERNPFSGICQYDVRIFDGRTILAVLEAHPFLLLRGQVLRNPNYVRARELGPGSVRGDARSSL